MTLLATRRIYTGRIINLDIDTVGFPNGTAGELEMIRHSGASAVVPLLDPADTADPRVVLIRQFRHAADAFIWEVPAGRLDPGEAPEACALRELQEETGYTAARLTRLTTIYPTPGFTDERIHLFVATDLTPGDGAPESDEFVEPQVLRWSEVLRLIGRGEVVDGKTLVSLLFVQCLLRQP